MHIPQSSAPNKGHPVGNPCKTCEPERLRIVSEFGFAEGAFPGWAAVFNMIEIEPVGLLRDGRTLIVYQMDDFDAIEQWGVC